MRPQFLRDTISVEPYEGSGARGPTYGNAVVVKASFQPLSKVIIDFQGKQVQAEALAIIRPKIDFPPESRVTASDGRVFRVLVSHPYPDLKRKTHIELTLGSLVDA